MPKKNTILAFSILLIVLAGIAAAYLQQQRKVELDASSEAFALEITLAILEGSLEPFEVYDDLPPSNSVARSAQLLTENSDDRFSEARPLEILQSSLTADFGLLGSLVSMDSIAGESIPSRMLIGPNTTTANYLIDTTFTEGNSAVEISLIETQGRWWISGFELESTAIDH